MAKFPKDENAQAEIVKPVADENAQAEIVKPVADENAQAEIVRMVRGEEYPEPRSAEVHPAEVENYRSGGWIEA